MHSPYTRAPLTNRAASLTTGVRVRVSSAFHPLPCFVLLSLCGCARTELAVQRPISRCEAAPGSAIPSRIALRTASVRVELRHEGRPFSAATTHGGALVFRERSGRAIALEPQEVRPFDVRLLVGEYDVEYVANASSGDRPLPIGGVLASPVSVYAGRAPLVLEMRPREVTIPVAPAVRAPYNTLSYLLRCEHGGLFFPLQRDRTSLRFSMLGPSRCRALLYETLDCGFVRDCTANLSQPFDLVPEQSVTLRDEEHTLATSLQFTGEWRPTSCRSVLGLQQEGRWIDLLRYLADGVPPTFTSSLPVGRYDFAIIAACEAPDGSVFAGTHRSPMAVDLDRDRTVRASVDLTPVRVRVTAPTTVPLATYELTLFGPDTSSSASVRVDDPTPTTLDLAVARGSSRAWITITRRSFDEESPPPYRALIQHDVAQADIARGEIELVAQAVPFRGTLSVDGRAADPSLYALTISASIIEAQRLPWVVDSWAFPELTAVAAGPYALRVTPSERALREERAFPMHPFVLDPITVDAQGRASIAIETVRARGSVTMDGELPRDEALTLRVVSARGEHTRATIAVRQGRFDATLLRDEWRATLVGRECIAGDNHDDWCGELALSACDEAP